ncbi:Protein of unknown function, DUF547 [Lutibacter oricola]|uniref:DUF547 domain-containing protein n=1 Tax=Lutibacter oricola TaxID=762486 RepID=A0A1H2ZEM1_9FLAO|nr:DUF547 domain-containing protein [Lutibacter oricola]SDX15831.1 Protein of unknown function, DUF547 [Lutibacter oricola]
MKKIYIVIFALIISTQVNSQETAVFFKKANTFFKANVSNGKVAYNSIHKNQAELNELLMLAKNIKVDKSTKNEYQAFWINAYNLTVIKGIIDNYPTKSPLSIGGFFDKTTYELGSTKTTLNNIEHQFLRGNFNDARFHFVLVCGAIGCPPLIAEAYMPSTVNKQLEKQTKLALNGDYFITVNAKKKKVIGSEILKWYKEDFTMNGASEIDFINKYRTEKIPSNYKLTYSTYNWNLNKQ